MSNEHDVIVIGGRCAGASTAMLLARRGYRVLVVDRAVLPSDTVSTHLVHAPGVAALRRWGVLDEIVATGCPPIDTFSFDFGPFTIRATPHPAEGSSTAYSPRRPLLDGALLAAAVRAGAEVRDRFTVVELVADDGRIVGIRGQGADGRLVEERAKVVVGADGRASTVARAVRAEAYHTKPALQCAAYTYWRGLPVDGFATTIRPHRGWAAMPTNDGLTLLAVGWPIAEAAAYKADIEGGYVRTLDLVPDFAARVAEAERAEPFRVATVENWFRKPFGPGWALVGDAGYNRDPITAQGITDAFSDAEAASAAIDAWLDGRQGFGEAMAAYQRDRDRRVLPMYEFTTQLATLEGPPPELQQLLAAVAGDEAAMSAFVSVVAGTMSPLDFFDPANIAAMLERGRGRAA
jgi:2-polyprenyl-6-methoxyphenol hydroxylase-like FAD-dependent oxidoreductase